MTRNSIPNGSFAGVTSVGIVMEGILWKKGSKLSTSKVWNERYFVLRGTTLSYYLRRFDVVPKGTFRLLPSCLISEVYITPSDSSKDKKPHQELDLISQGVKESVKYHASIQNQITSMTSKKLKKKKDPKEKEKKGDAKEKEEEKKEKKKKERYCFKITWPDKEHSVESSRSLPHLPRTNVSTEQLSSGDEEPPPMSQPSPTFPAIHHSPSTPTPSSSTSPLRRNRSLDVEETIHRRNYSTSDVPLPNRSRSRSHSHSNQDQSRSRQHPLPSPTIEHVPSHSDDDDDDDDDTVHVIHRNFTNEADDGIQRHYSRQVQQFNQERQDEEEKQRAIVLAHKKASQKKTRKRIAQGGGLAAACGAAVTATVLTAGAGLAGVLVFAAVSAAAGGSGAVVGRSYWKSKKGHVSLVLAAKSLEEANKWKAAIEAAITGETAENETWVGLFQQEGRSTTTCLLPTSKKEDKKTVTKWTPGKIYETSTRWRPLEGGWAVLMASGAQGLRIFQEEREDTLHRGVRKIFRRQLSVEGRPCPPLKAQLILNATPLNAFMCLMSQSRIDTQPASTDFVPRSQQRASFRIVETIDDHMDVIHLIFRPIYLFPSWTGPRDFCLLRFWRFEDDGSYIVCYDSIQHRECPPLLPYVRGELHGTITIAPTKRRRTTSTSPPECLLTHIVQVDPRGWVPTVSLPLLSGQSYAEAFAVSALLQMLDVKDALDHDRFINVSLDVLPPTTMLSSQKISTSLNEPLDGNSVQSQDSEDNLDYVNYDFAYATLERKEKEKEEVGITINTFPDSLFTRMWAEPDANSFMVRGKTYLKDKKKINAGESMLQLICVDLIEVNTPIMSGVCNHPKERVQQALLRNEENDMPAFVVAINIVLPGPPYYHLMMYYSVDDIAVIDGTANTPFSKLAKEFFFGESDEFRDKTFKLIPQIVEGNFLVRKAVGSTPAIMGTKLKQTYVRGEKFFELVLDVGSSSVAAGVVRLSVGYAKTLVVDMAFLLEGNDESTLPERAMGCCRLKNVDFSQRLRFVEATEDD